MSERTGKIIMAWAYGVYVTICAFAAFTVDTGSDQGDTIVQIAACIFAVLPAIEWRHLQQCKREREQRRRSTDRRRTVTFAYAVIERCDLCAEPMPRVACPPCKLKMCGPCAGRHSGKDCYFAEYVPYVAEPEARIV